MNKKTTEKLNNIIKEVLEADVTDDLSMDTASSWDSLRHIQLLAKIEEAFKVEIDFKDTLAMTNLKSIREILEKYISGK